VAVAILTPVFAYRYDLQLGFIAALLLSPAALISRRPLQFWL
jgi:hypothetical protein